MFVEINLMFDVFKRSRAILIVKITPDLEIFTIMLIILWN